jgi:hypothetical protein
MAMGEPTPPSSLTERGERRRLSRQERSDLRFWHPVVGEIVDVSPIGMAVKTNHILDIGKVYFFRTRWRSKLIVFLGTVRWCSFDRVRPSGASLIVPVFRAGVEFTDGLSRTAQEFLVGEETAEQSANPGLADPGHARPERTARS